MESYENLLKRVYERLPKNLSSHERFEMPRVEGHIQGSKTIISNFVSVYRNTMTMNKTVDEILLQEEFSKDDLTLKIEHKKLDCFEHEYSRREKNL